MPKPVQYPWARIVLAQYKGNDALQVLLYLNTSDGDTETVKIQAMVKEYYLVEKVRFSSREAAFGFIDTFSEQQASAFVARQAKFNVPKRTRKK